MHDQTNGGDEGSREERGDEGGNDDAEKAGDAPPAKNALPEDLPEGECVAGDDPSTADPLDFVQGFDLHPACDIAPAPVQWLWPNRIPREFTVGAQIRG